ncbi:MAG: response regulator, partial [Microcoleus sp. Co-bin12]|nr:response regulator [Microcoleus sp. Co-bin12]
MWIKILLVEDNPADADLLAELLEVSVGVQWELVSVEFLHEAIAQLCKQPFDVVLLDLSLPDSRGLETLTRLREVAPDTAMVVMTGLDDEAIALESVRLGAQDYIVKGQITTQLLVRTIRYAIERSQTFQMLRESERRFRAIFDSSFQLTKLLTPEGIVLEVNETSLEFTGMRLEDIVGRPIWEMEIWAQSLQVCEQLQSAIGLSSRGEFFRSEIDLLAKSGQIVTLDFSLKPVKNETGQVLLLIAEARDISERKRAEAEILKALAREKELSELRAKFVTMVSHEFRTPLTTIQFSAGLL